MTNTNFLSKEKFLKSLRDEFKEIIIDDSELERMIEDVKTKSICR